MNNTLNPEPDAAGRVLNNTLNPEPDAAARILNNTLNPEPDAAARTTAANPKRYRQAPTHWLKFYDEAVIV